MQPALTLLSGLALAGTSLAVPEPRALSFTTWPCANCALQGPPSCGQAQEDYQNLTSETCYPLRNGPSQDSIRVNASLRPDCFVKLYKNSACTGAGPQYENIGNYCQLIVEEGSTHFQVICPA